MHGLISCKASRRSSAPLHGSNIQSRCGASVGGEWSGKLTFCFGPRQSKVVVEVRKDDPIHSSYRHHCNRLTLLIMIMMAMAISERISFSFQESDLRSLLFLWGVNCWRPKSEVVITHGELTSHFPADVGWISHWNPYPESTRSKPGWPYFELPHPTPRKEEHENWRS